MESLYRRHRLPSEIISHAVWLYHRFTLSFRDVEDLLAERGITVSYEAIRSWCRKFGPAYALALRRRQGRLGDIWHVDEVFITIRGDDSSTSSNISSPEAALDSRMRIPRPPKAQEQKAGTVVRPAKKFGLPLLLLGLNLTLAVAQQTTLRQPDVTFVPTPQSVVEQMLKLASVKPGGVVYDLGCGDGRVVITAAKRYGVRAVGIDIDPERINQSMENAREAEVEDRVSFRNEDLFEADIREATVVTLYLLHSLNLKLRPKLWKELKPGTRIVSYNFDMGDWPPEKQIGVLSGTIYLWTIPANGTP